MEEVVSGIAEAIERVERERENGPAVPEWDDLAVLLACARRVVALEAARGETEVLTLPDRLTTVYGLPGNGTVGDLRVAISTLLDAAADGAGARERAERLDRMLAAATLELGSRKAEVERLTEDRDYRVSVQALRARRAEQRADQAEKKWKEAHRLHNEATGRFQGKLAKAEARVRELRVKLFRERAEQHGLAADVLREAVPTIRGKNRMAFHLRACRRFRNIADRIERAPLAWKPADSTELPWDHLGPIPEANRG